MIKLKNLDISMPSKYDIENGKEEGQLFGRCSFENGLSFNIKPETITKIQKLLLQELSDDLTNNLNK